jgi:hypothetical protein
MTPVSKEDFYLAIGPRDVHPKVDASTLKFRHHVSIWETPQRRVVGRSHSDSWGIEPTTYQLEGDGERWLRQIQDTNRIARQAGAAIEQAHPFGYRSEDKEP